MQKRIAVVVVIWCYICKQLGKNTGHSMPLYEFISLKLLGKHRKSHFGAFFFLLQNLGGKKPIFILVKKIIGKILQNES